MTIQRGCVRLQEREKYADIADRELMMKMRSDMVKRFIYDVYFICVSFDNN